MFLPDATKPQHAIHFLGWSAEQWSTAAAVATTLAFGVGVIAAFIALSQIKQSRRVHRDQTRPYVVISAEPSVASSVFMDVVVRNVGSTPAYDLMIKIDPPFERSGLRRRHELADAKMFTERISMWAPGFEYRVLFDQMADRMTQNRDLESRGEEPLAATYTATLTYYAREARQKRWWRRDRRKPWRETQLIDVEIGKGTSSLEIKGAHHIAKSLDGIDTVLKSATNLSGTLSAIVEDRAVREKREEDEGREEIEWLVAKELRQDNRDGT